MKHIVMFSGGAASSYVAWMVSQEQKKEDIILLHTPTGAEDKDADRFRKEVSEYVGIPITEHSKGKDLWQVIEKEGILPSQFIPFCTTQLKIIPSNEFVNGIKEDKIVYLGYGKNEWRRVQKYRARNDEKWTSSFPIYEKQIEDREVKEKIQNCWGVKLPEPYKYLKHNNCIPCFKAGKKEWVKYAKYYPEQFERALQLEKQYGYTIFKDCTLENIKIMASHPVLFDSIQEIDTTPCECVY